MWATGGDGSANPISITERAAPRVDTNDRSTDVDSSDCVIPRLLTVSISPFRLMMISSGRDFPRDRVTVEGCSKRENPEESPYFRGGIRNLVPLGLQKTPAVSAEQNWERRRLSASWAVRPKFPRFAVFVREGEALAEAWPGKTGTSRPRAIEPPADEPRARIR